MKQSNHVVVSESYKRGKRVNAQQRRDNAAIDAVAEQWRKDPSAPRTDNVLVTVAGKVLMADRVTAYALLHAKEAKLVLDLETKVDYLAVAE